MAEGFRTISLTIWEKMNIKGEGKMALVEMEEKEGRRGVMVQQPHMEHAT